MQNVNLEALKKYYEDKRLSASGIKEYDQCPKKYFYNKIEKLPTLDHNYFDTGKRVEEELYRMLGADMQGYDEIPTEDEKDMAMALYKFKPFRALIDSKELTFQKEYYTETMKALTDIETPDCVIDIKTSASSWTDEMVRESRWQAKIYTKITGKQFYFCIVTKKTKTCQLIKVTVKDFDDLDLKIEELNLAIEFGIFEPIPSYKCKFCDYKSTCESDRGFTK